MSKILRILTKPVDEVIAALEKEKRQIDAELRSARAVRAMIQGGKVQKKSPHRRIVEREGARLKPPTGPSQKAVYEYILKQNRPVTVAEIAEALGKKHSTAYMAARPMVGRYLKRVGKQKYALR